MTLRNYTNTSVETTLTSGIDASVTSLTVDDATGYPSAPFAIVLDPDSVASEEVLLVTFVAGTTFTVTRGYDGTTGKPHSAGATVIHAAIAADFVDGQVSGLDTQVQFNDAGAFAGDAGLTYDKTIQQLVVSADDADKTTPLFRAVSGAFHASEIAAVGGSNGDLLYTAVSTGTAGNDITVTYDALGFDQPLAIAVAGSAITVHMATDSFATVTSTANDVLAAVNADVDASALVTATLAPGNDGTGLVGPVFIQLAGGGTAGDTAWIDERGIINVHASMPLGENSINIRNPDGDVLSHLDNDGGFSFANGAFTASQLGALEVNTTQPIPLVGNATLRFSINSFGMFTIAAGGGACFNVGSPVASDDVFVVYAFTAQTGDLIVAYDEGFVKGFRVLPRGAVVIAQHTAPDDSQLATGQMAIWFDQTPSAAKLMIKAKDSDGTVVTGEVALA